MAEPVEQGCPFKGQVAVDESCFGPTRIRGHTSGFAAIPKLVSRTPFAGLFPHAIWSLAARHNLRILEVNCTLPPLERRLVWHSRLAFDPIFSWLRNLMIDKAAQNRATARM